MHALILAMIVAVTTFGYIVSKGWLHPYFNYVPELLSLVALVYVMVAGVQSRFRFVPPLYWLVFGGLLLVLVCGAFVNQLQPGPMFAGLRIYLRALPFFLLPAVLLITPRQLQKQLYVLLAMALIQLPLAWSQRMGSEAMAARRGGTWASGDYTVGTIGNSTFLTIFCIGAACVLTGYYLQRRISTGRFLLLLLWLVLPTTLNETKATIVLLPLALLVTFYVGSEAKYRLKNTLLGSILAISFLAIFIPIYDHFMQPRWGYGLIEFFTMEGRVEGYLMKGTEVGDQARAGRLDGMIAAATELSKDPSKLFFGLGIGNASDSALGAQFDGAYYRQFEVFPLNSFSFIMLEHGLLGVFLVLWLHWIIFRDCVFVARRERSLIGALAMGWAGIGPVIVISLIYHTPITNLTTTYLYWYFSGLLVTSRMRMELRAYGHSELHPASASGG